MTTAANTSGVTSGIQKLQQVMTRLRDPDHGCPWDLKQTLTSLIPYTIEEAYEVAAALTEGDPAEIKDELGDLLFQVVFYTHLTAEKNWFDFDAVAAGMADKLMRRHPHVFGDETASTDAEIKARWEQIKQQERAEKGQTQSVFDGVPSNLPAVLMATKLQKRAATVGFDWPDPEPVIAKIREELEEVEAELQRSERDQAAVAAEVGDLLFAVTNLARHLSVNTEHALSSANTKFKRRFQAIEERLREREQSPQQLTLAGLEEEWQAVKQQEK
ncbi:MAG: nucleoside triphosphate pyrophosphohydrolase [Idiomarina sp.]